MSAPLAVVIVNYNSGRHLGRCLRSIQDHLTDAPWQCAVIDNASGDSSERAAEGFAPRVTVRRNEANLGFARAANQGIAATSGELVLLLNPDCCLLPGAAEALSAELHRYASCAVVGPRVLNRDGSVQASARGDPTMVTGLFGRSSLLTHVFPGSAPVRKDLRVHLAPAAGDGSVEVDWVSGACMLARREALATVGGFDERYFLYWEDADLCRRLRMRGYSVRYAPRAQVIHEAAGSTNPTPREAIRAFHRSAYTYYATHVATSPWQPTRSLAWLLLEIRCAWKLLATPSDRAGDGG